MEFQFKIEDLRLSDMAYHIEDELLFCLTNQFFCSIAAILSDIMLVLEQNSILQIFFW